MFTSLDDEIHTETDHSEYYSNRIEAAEGGQMSEGKGGG